MSKPVLADDRSVRSHRTSGRAAISRITADEPQSATFVELFFDLVFVFAITQLTKKLVHDLDWVAVGQVAALFWLVWWAWTQFTWTLNLADTEHTWVRLPTLAATAVAFFLAQAIPDAFGTAGVWFAVSYVVVRAIGLAVQYAVLKDDQRAAVVRWITVSQLGLALVLVGGFVGGELRIWLWAAAFLVDVVATFVAGRLEWVLAPGHFAERHGLIVIIALGESLIAAGVATADLERDLTFGLVVSGAVVATCALWWTYFGALQPRLEHRLAAQPPARMGSFARDVYSLSHALVVLGVIGIAAAFEEAVAHPDEPLGIGGAIALTLGSAFFLGGLAAAARRSGVRGAASPRLIAAAVALAATPVLPTVAAPAALWGLALLVIGADLFEAARPAPVVA